MDFLFFFCKVEDHMTLQVYTKKGPFRMLTPRRSIRRYTPDEYVTRAKKVLIDFVDKPPRRSGLRRMRNDEEEEEEEDEPDPEVHRKIPPKEGVRP
jgi:hypothetical protein